MKNNTRPATPPPLPRFVRTLHAAFLAVGCALSAARADNWAPNITTSALWHNNVTNSEQSADQIDSLDLKLDLLSSQRYALGRDDTILATAHLGTDWWLRYRGYTTATAGGRGEWQHKFGANPLAPTLSLEGAADAILAKESGRRGVLASVTLALRKRFDELTRGAISHEVSYLDSHTGTFDATASETSLSVERDLNDVTRLTLAVRFRDGDVVTYATPPRPDLAALAPNQVDVDTFGRPMRAYRIDARTWSTRIGLARALDQSSAVIAAYEWRSSSRGSLTFTNNILSVSLVHQF